MLDYASNCVSINVVSSKQTPSSDKNVLKSANFIFY